MRIALTSFTRHPADVALRRTTRPLARLTLIAALTTLIGCASPSADQALGPLQAQLTTTLGRPLGTALTPWPDATAPSEAARERSLALLAQPLTADGAIELALLNHRGLQAALADLGVTQAELAQAGRLPNPGFSFKRTHGGDTVERERGLHLSLGRLLLRPLLQQAASGRLVQQQAQTTLQVVEQIARVRRTWVDAVAAEESLHYQHQVMDAAQAGAELARRMARVGNFNKLAVAREESFEADAALGVSLSERQRTASRERLIRALGLASDPNALKLPPRLPDLPTEPAAQPDIEARALAQRMDVQAARTATEHTARALGLTRSTRFINVLELGVLDTRTSTPNSEVARSRGWEVGLELPLFDWGDARVARAEAVYTASLHRTAEIALDARSEVREAYHQFRYAWDVANQWQQTIVPLKQRISEENLLRYNGMQIGVFELLADARAQVSSVQAAIDARREFWRAEADLHMAMLGRPSLNAGAGAMPTSSAGAAGGSAH